MSSVTLNQAHILMKDRLDIHKRGLTKKRSHKCPRMSNGIEYSIPLELGTVGNPQIIPLFYHGIPRSLLDTSPQDTACQSEPCGRSIYVSK